MKAIAIRPVWGDNYRPGFVGFTFNDHSFVSKGIVYFTRWDRMSDFKASHTLIATGEDACVEAQGKGVVEDSLSKYFDDLRYAIAFRKPMGWTPELGDRIVASVRQHIGKKYGYALIVGNAITHSTVGRLFGKITRGWTTRVISKWFDGKKQEICSETVALALQDQPELANLGILKQHANTITPQMLFEDDELFEEWKHGQ